MPKITVEKDKCKGCMLCVSVCPKEVIKSSKKLNKKGVKSAVYIGKGCIGCMQCAFICPDICIEVYK